MVFVTKAHYRGHPKRLLLVYPVRGRVSSRHQGKLGRMRRLGYLGRDLDVFHPFAIGSYYLVSVGDLSQVMLLVNVYLVL